MVQFVLRALFNNTKDIQTDGVGAWNHGEKAIAVMQPFQNRRALAPIVLRNICFQRAERLTSPQSQKLFYFIVLQRGYDDFVFSGENGKSVGQYLNSGRELTVLFSEVPCQDLICCICGFKQLGTGPACFVDGMARCSPYCSVSQLDMY